MRGCKRVSYFAERELSQLAAMVANLTAREYFQAY